MPRQDVREKKITFKLMIQEPICNEFGGGELINDNKLSYFFKQFS